MFKSTTRLDTYAAFPPLPHAKIFFSLVNATMTKLTNSNILSDDKLLITPDDSFLYNSIKSE